MKPKLIILNGSPAIGKSTIAQKYIDNHPMALKLDIDQLWFMLGQWQKSRPRSSDQKMKLAYVMAGTHLQDGYDVIVAQHLDNISYYKIFESIAAACGANMYEVLLHAPVQQAIERCIERGKASGYPTGFRPGGILETEGKDAKIAQMHKAAQQVCARRPKTLTIVSDYGDTQSTYEQVLQHVN
jgi:chloramphenicol 3-O-phosphotransferase